MVKVKCRFCSGRLSVHVRNILSICIYCSTCHRIAVVSEGPARSSLAQLRAAYAEHVEVSREKR